MIERVMENGCWKRGKLCWLCVFQREAFPDTKQEVCLIWATKGCQLTPKLSRSYTDQMNTLLPDLPPSVCLLFVNWPTLKLF